MNPAQLALLILQGLLKGLPMAVQMVEIFRERGEYSDDEWNSVKTKVEAWKSDPAWTEEPDPTG